MKSFNGSIVKRLSAESVSILKTYDSAFDVTNMSPDAAIATMHVLIQNNGTVPNTPAVAQPAHETPSQVLACRYDETRLLKRMEAVCQTACDNAIRPYVSQ